MRKHQTTVFNNFYDAYLDRTVPTMIYNGYEQQLFEQSR